MDGTGRSDAARDLRAAGRTSPRRRRAGAGAAGQPAGGVPAPEGAQGRGTGHRPARGQPSRLSARSRWGGRSARLPRPVLDPVSGGLQAGRRTSPKGGLMTPQVLDTSVRTSITVQAPIERAFKVFTEGIGT